MRHRAIFYTLPVLVAVILFTATTFAKTTTKQLKKATESQDPATLAAAPFVPHVTGDAITRDQWGFGLQRIIGSNINTNPILSAVSLTIIDRLELSTIPAYYFVKEHRHNFALRYNFWRGREFSWTVGAFTAQFDFTADSVDQSVFVEPPILEITATQLLMNYRPNWTKLSFGISFGGVDTRVRGETNAGQVFSFDVQHELLFDLSYPVTDEWIVTIGLGRQRVEGITAFEDVEFGYGATVGWHRPGRFLSLPAIGVHHTPETDDVQFIFTAKIL